MKPQIPKNLSPLELRDWLVQEGTQPLLVDVREDQELAIAPFPFPVLHLPLSKFAVWAENLPLTLEKNQPVVILCHSGVRSLNFAHWLIEQHWSEDVWNLEGGIDAWSVNVDSDVPRY